ncbi:MAG: type VII secretion integral membrane protein EccD [Actinomycetes bacterium]
MSDALVDSGLVRVTLVAGARRVDLAVPGVVPVAEVLPELVSAVGVLDPYTVHGGYRLVRPDGTTLQGAAGLVAQGVEDGHVLTVEAGVDDEPPKVYDDVVEAVADAIEAQTRPWTPEASRRTGLAASGALLAVAAVTLALQRAAGLPVAVTAAVVAVLLVASAAVLSRVRGEHETGLLLGWSAVPFAAIAGWALLPDRSPFELPSVAAGLGMTSAGAAAAGAVAGRALRFLPAMGFGVTVAAVGAVCAATDVDPAQVVTTAMVLLVLVGGLVPWLSVSTTRLAVPQPRTDADITAEPPPLDAASIAGEVRLGRNVLLGLSVLVSAAVVTAAPFAVSLGLFGALVVVCAGIAMLLRTRQYRDAVEVRTGVAGAALALVAAAVSAALLQPSWRTGLVVILLVTGTALVLAAVLPRTPSVRLGRMGDVLDGVTLVAMLPLLVVALGLV